MSLIIVHAQKPELMQRLNFTRFTVLFLLMTSLMMVTSCTPEDDPIQTEKSLVKDYDASVPLQWHQLFPVSYTHLDVYKRQLIHRAALPPSPVFRLTHPHTWKSRGDLALPHIHSPPKLLSF